MVDKVKLVADVVQTIPSSAHIGLGGFATPRKVIAVVHELIRLRTQELTISQGIVGRDTDLLVGAGLVKHVIALHPGFDLEELKENTGFPLHIPNKVPTTVFPTAEELRLLRQESDPIGVYLK